jgi:hypothetical protein
MQKWAKRAEYGECLQAGTDREANVELAIHDA